MTIKAGAKVAAKRDTGIKPFMILAPAAILALGASVMAAKAQDVTVSHGYSFFGDLKYPAEFDHLE